MFDSLRWIPVKSNIFTNTLSFAVIILLIVLADSIISNVSLHSNAFRHDQSDNNHIDQLKTRQTSRLLQITDHHLHPETNGGLKPDYSRLFDPPHSARRFDSRVRKFFGTKKSCKVQFFMTWISPADSFGEREFFALESLFQSNPESCLIILSTTMDSEEGIKILDPLVSRGFRVRSLSPDLYYLLKNTPAETWFEEIKNGTKNPGEIPLQQNLSNLIRLAVLYKYGGVYLDTDFIILKDFSSLRNSIGAQSTDVNGNWSRLNNAVLVFDKKHPLVYKFLEEFALTFDGNIWGHNGPYLVSRVVDRVAKTGKDFNFTVLPPIAFYPFDWTRIYRFFARPNDPDTATWVEAKIRHLNRCTYGVHLWNRESSRFKIEEESIIWRLISDHCLICNSSFSSS